MKEPVMLSIRNQVATLALNRPEVLNALDESMLIRFCELAEALEADSDVRAVVLRGEGPAFCAGGDVKRFHANLPRLPQLIISLGRELNRAILALRRMAKPVLASVHGAVAGAGVSLLAAADLAVAAQGTRFTLAYDKIGACPDGGVTYFLPRLVGYRKAVEWMLLGETFDSQTAIAQGLVNWVVPAEQLAEKTEEIAARLASGPTYAHGQTKALMNQAFDASLSAQLEAEIQAFSRCARSADLAEGVAAFVEKRGPVFVGK